MYDFNNIRYDLKLSPKEQAKLMMLEYRNKKDVIKVIETIRDSLDVSVFKQSKQKQENIDMFDYFTQVKIELEKL